MNLFKLARSWQTIKAIGSGKPDRIARRGKNIALGRAAARGGLWRRIWGGGR